MVVASPILKKKVSSPKGSPKAEGKVKGADSVLKGSVKKLQLPEDDGTPVTITKVRKIVKSQITRLQPKIVKKVSKAVQPFDPRAMLAKIFKGGLGQLEAFAKSLQSLKKPLQEIFKFIDKAKKIFVSLLKKLTKINLSPKTESAKEPKKKKGGLIQNILKGAATLGLIALTTWGVSKLLKKGRESQKVKPGSKVTPIEPVEGTELLNKKEIKKFNKAVKTLQETIWNFEDQVKKAAKGKDPEGEEVKPETGEEQEKPKSLAGTTQTALIPGEEAPSELNVILPRDETSTAAAQKLQVIPHQETDSTVTTKEKVIPETTGSSGGVKVADHGDGGGAGESTVQKSTPLTTSNVLSTKPAKEDGTDGKEGMKGKRGESGATGAMRWIKGIGDLMTFNMNDWDGKNTNIETPEGEKPKGVMKVMAKIFDGLTGDTWNADKENQTKVEPSKDDSNIRKDNSLEVSQQADSSTDVETNENIIPVPLGTDPNQVAKQGTQPIASAQDTSNSSRVPFLLPFDNNNIAIMYSKNTYNIVDAL